MIAVVKANAYGHGAGQVARALEDAGADLLACADIEEGAALRAAGVTRGDPGVRRAERQRSRRPVRLPPDADDLDAGRGARRAGRGGADISQRLRYHLKIDTGMNRLGFRFDNLRRTLPELLASENLELDAVYTHFATADDPESPLFDEQRRRFERALRRNRRRSAARPRYRHAAQQRGAAARFARAGTTACAPACCCTASCRRRSRRRFR